MYKTQKTFSPLECGLCKHYGCKYYKYYEQNYRAGFKVPASDCERIQQEKQRVRFTRGRF